MKFTDDDIVYVSHNTRLIMADTEGYECFISRVDVENMANLFGCVLVEVV